MPTTIARVRQDPLRNQRTFYDAANPEHPVHDREGASPPIMAMHEPRNGAANEIVGSSESLP